jgi:hypothetical protein
MVGWWNMPKCNQSHFVFTGYAGIDPGLDDGTSFDLYSAIIHNSIINRTVDQTDIFATKKLLDGSDVTPHS